MGGFDGTTDNEVNPATRVRTYIRGGAEPCYPAGEDLPVDIHTQERDSSEELSDSGELQHRVARGRTQWWDLPAGFILDDSSIEISDDFEAV